MTEPEKAATPVLNGAGRTDDEERLVRWTYYLDMGIAALERNGPLIRLLLQHGYEHPADVLREIKAALTAEREAKNLRGRDTTDSSVSP